MKKTTLRRSLVPLTLAAALALSACSEGETASFETTSAQSAADAEPAQDGADDETGDGEAAAQDTATDDTADDAEETDVTAQSAAAAGVDPATVGPALATGTVPVEVDGDPEATMDVSIHSLTREGSTLIGIFSFTVSSTATDAEPEWLYDYLGQQSWRPHLIDTVNLTRHDVLVEAGAWAKTDSQGSNFFRPGQTVYGYAAFAAPPEDVDTMLVNLIEGAPAAEVPLQ